MQKTYQISCEIKDLWLEDQWGKTTQRKPSFVGLIGEKAVQHSGSDLQHYAEVATNERASVLHQCVSPQPGNPKAGRVDVVEACF